MRAIKAITAMLLLPGTVTVLIPYLILSNSNSRFSASWAGFPILVVGLLILCRCVYDFYKTGQGTLAHWSPPKKLVTVGLYRWVRNPMYVGVVLILMGESVLAGSIWMLFYLVCVFTAFNLHIIFIEEPWAERTFGDEWRVYKSSVSRWLIRRPKE